jgi:hypothetical protein
MADVTKEIALKVVATDATGPALESLEDKLNAAKKRMVELAAAGKQNTEEFQRLQVEAGNYKRTIEGVEQSVDSFAKGGSKAFTLIVEASQAVAAGFAIAQGAAALFGDENEDLQKAMVQVQGAMALVNGVQQINILLTQKSVITTEAAALAQKLYALAVGTSTGAMRAFRLALLATGVGAFVVVLGFAAEAMGAFSSSTKKSTEELERQKQAAEDGKKAMELYYRSLAAFGLDEIKINERKIAQYKNELQAREMMMQTIKGQNAEINGMNQQQLQNRITELKTLVKETENANKEIRKGRSEQIKSSTKERNQEGNQIIDFVKETNLLLYENQLDAQAAAEQAVIDGMRREGQARASAAANATEIEKKKLEDQKIIEQQKIELASSGFATIGELANAFAGESEQSQKRAFNINKAAGIAQTIIDTFAAAQGAYKSQMTIPDPSAPIRASIAAGIAVAQGLARVAAISKTQFKSTSSVSSTPVPTVGGGGASTTPPPIFANPQTTMLGTDGAAMNGQGQGMQPMRAYVVERDIQQTTSRVRRLSEFATLG